MNRTEEEMITKAGYKWRKDMEKCWVRERKFMRERE